jgi:hypothetical protein
MSEQNLNRWSCLPQAFAIALNLSLDEFIELIGHNGSAIMWPHLPEPLCRRGHTIQECIKVCLELGYSVTPIAVSYKHKPTPDTEPLNLYDREIFNAQVLRSRGVLTGACKKCHHAVTYNHGIIMDGGIIYLYSESNCLLHNFTPECLWRIDAI